MANGKFTITNLVCFTKYVLDSTEAGYQVDVIYTDFSKVFDKVDHNILIGKLSNLGIFSHLGNHLPKGMTQTVKIKVKTRVKLITYVADCTLLSSNTNIYEICCK